MAWLGALSGRQSSLLIWWPWGPDYVPQKSALIIQTELEYVVSQGIRIVTDKRWLRNMTWIWIAKLVLAPEYLRSQMFFNMFFKVLMA